MAERNGFEAPVQFLRLPDDNCLFPSGHTLTSCRIELSENERSHPRAGSLTISVVSVDSDRFVAENDNHSQSNAMSESGTDFYFNPFDLQFRANPYPHYAALLEGPPRLINLVVPAALVARYDEVVAVLRSAEFSAERPKIPMRERIDPFAGAPTVLTSDPPVHSRLRKLVSKAFTPRRVRELEPRIRAITSQLLDQVAAKGEFEAMADLANQLPVIVIAEMLGLSTEHHEQFKQWSNALISGFRPDALQAAPEESIQAKDALRAYFANEIERRRAAPGEDLVSALVAARDEAEALSEAELLAFVVLLLLAGNETTTNLIGNGLLALCRHPEQLERLRREPELMPTAIEEMLRYDPPVQMTARIALKDTNVGGTEIAAGTFLFLLLAAANRDPRRFPNPETFDVAREANDHLAFGEGIHFCLGAPLARLEGAIAISSVIQRFPALRLADADAELTYRGSLTLRGLSRLPLAINR
jgi:pimeloyl-[acyl-carrier protein] synthase